MTWLKGMIKANSYTDYWKGDNHLYWLKLLYFIMCQMKIKLQVIRGKVKAPKSGIGQQKCYEYKKNNQEMD